MESSKSFEFFIKNVEFLHSILKAEFFSKTLVFEKIILFVIFVNKTNRYFTGLFYFKT